ncbi:MAG: hypothetical protein ACHQ52_10620 [Candidatus Eisenbacteria bacterium]
MTPIVLDVSQPKPTDARVLEWTQPHWARPIWELRENEQVVVTLRRAHWYGGALLADIEGVAWRCARHGRQQQMARAEQDQPELAFRTLSWHGDEDTERLGLSRWRGDGPITHADGRRWFFRQHGLWRRVYWEVLDEAGRTIVTFRRRWRPFHIEGTAEIGAGVDPGEGLLAAVFGWTLLLREITQRRHAHAAAAGAG